MPMSPCSVIATRAPWDSRCAKSGRKFTANSVRSIRRSCAVSATASSPRIIRGRSTHSRRRAVHISYSPIPDASAPNGVGGVLATAFETTERVRNEKALHVLTDRLESEVEQRTRERDRIWKVSEDLLGVANFDGFILSANPAWTNLLGWSEDEIKSLHVNELRHPDDAAAAIAARRQLARGTQNVRIENRFRHRDGSWRWIAWTMTTDDGLIYVSGRHISAEKKSAEDLRQSDQQFRALVAGVTD